MNINTGSGRPQKDTMYEPLNTVIVYPEFTSNGAEPLPTPEGWTLYLSSAVWLETTDRRYAVLRAPLGTPIPPEGREVLRQNIVNIRQPYAQGRVLLTPEEREALAVYGEWSRARERNRESRWWWHEKKQSGTQAPSGIEVPEEEPLDRNAWEEQNPEPFCTPRSRLPVHFRILAEKGLIPESIVVTAEPAMTLDPWVTPHHLSASKVATIATRLPGTELTTVVVREPQGPSDRWTVALGIGGHMRHLRGGHTSYEKARDAGVHDLLQARLAATTAMRQIRQNWTQWGIDWRQYLGTLTIVRAGPRQNAWSAILEPARVETIPDPNLGGL